MSKIPSTHSQMNRWVLERFPNASVEFDNNGQIVIYTGLCVSRQDPKMEKLVTIDEYNLEEDDT